MPPDHDLARTVRRLRTSVRLLSAMVATTLLVLTVHLVDLRGSKALGGVRPSLPGGKLLDVRIRFAEEPGAFPQSWTGGKIVALPPAKESDALAALRKSVAKYPQSVIDRYLRRVYVFKSMSWDGRDYGGTYDHDSRTVYLTMDDWYRSADVEEAFFHEFASILLAWAPAKFKLKEWAPLNDFEAYEQLPANEGNLDDEDSLEYDPKLQAEGYLNEYAMTNAEEDFDVVSEGLFSGNPAFWAAVDRFPKIRQKAREAMAFYWNVHPWFTESYFRSL